MKYLPILLLFAVAGCTSSLPVFEIISSANSKPLKNHKVVLYNGDVRFKLRRGTNPYPYKATNKYSCFLDELTTDDFGVLKLDKTYKCRSIIFVIGEEYRITKISFSSNLSHTFSQNHIRIVDFVDNSTKVQGNYIYDLKTKEVSYISINGNKTKNKFKYIKIKAIKKSP